MLCVQGVLLVVLCVPGVLSVLLCVQGVLSVVVPASVRTLRCMAELNAQLRHSLSLKPALYSTLLRCQLLNLATLASYPNVCF